jgi:hypothetical protein
MFFLQKKPKEVSKRAKFERFFKVDRMTLRGARSSQLEVFMKPFFASNLLFFYFSQNPV